MSVLDVPAAARTAWQPPPRLLLSDWIERYIVLPAGASALPGPMRLFPYQREIADVMSDPEIEKITLVKASRIGFTALITAAIGSYISNDPAQILVVLPTESDARDFTISDLEPTFAATPVLRNALKVEPGETDRNTILSRRFPGGSLKIVASRAPRNLRRHTARLLFVDEADACEQNYRRRSDGSFATNTRARYGFRGIRLGHRGRGAQANPKSVGGNRGRSPRRPDGPSWPTVAVRVGSGRGQA